MFLWKGRLAAGHPVPIIKPATVLKETRVSCFILAGLVAVPMILTALATSQWDVKSRPARKPETAALILNEARLRAANDDKVSGVGTYVSRFSNDQTEMYRDIFRLQSLGKMAQADSLIASLADTSLMGHVLAQRYLHPSYKAGFRELELWLSRYADHPQAARISRLARLRMPAGHPGIAPAAYSAAPIAVAPERAMAARIYHPALKRTEDQDSQAAAMIATVRTFIERSEPSAALRAFNENPVSAYLDDTEKNRIRAMVASGYFYAGKLAEARKMSGAALAASGEKAPLAGWVHGLTLWREGKYAQSAPSFESTANSPYATGWMASAASYWAARAHKEAGHSRKSKAYLEKAASYPRAFYGLLAAQALGRDAAVKLDVPSLSKSDENVILSTKAGLRAERLLAAGEVLSAEAELRGLYIQGDATRKRALLAYAYDRRLPSLAMTLGHAQEAGHASADAALYPAMPWSPPRGYKIDRALLHAIARQESRFNASAENGASGATGLMQIMPATAWHITRMDLYREAGGRALLKNPENSLGLAQEYIEELLNNANVGQDLMSLAIAYNAGPGTLARWKAERADIKDPLLFMETVPFAETRNYVSRVMANYWIYRMKFGQPNESMEALAEGRWARYAAYDKGALKFAQAR